MASFVSKDVSGLMNSQGRGQSNSFLLKWPKCHTKYGIENIAKITTISANPNLWDSTSPLNKHPNTRTNIFPPIHLCHLYSVASPTGVETVVLHLICIITSCIGTIIAIVTQKPQNLSFSLTPENGCRNTFIS